MEAKLAQRDGVHEMRSSASQDTATHTDSYPQAHTYPDMHICRRHAHGHTQSGMHTHTHTPDRHGHTQTHAEIHRQAHTAVSTALHLEEFLKQTAQEPEVWVRLQESFPSERPCRAASDGPSQGSQSTWGPVSTAPSRKAGAFHELRPKSLRPPPCWRRREAL